MYNNNQMYNNIMGNNPMNNMNPNMYQTYTENTGCGCNNQLPLLQGPCCTQTKTFSQYIPQPVNYHTHTINTVIRKRYVVPTYSNSEETVFVDENPCCNRNRRFF